ncbi:hypothetical protein OAH18_00420 [bacterium]|nr:hypothetical protein [bacterium]
MSFPTFHMNKTQPRLPTKQELTKLKKAFRFDPEDREEDPYCILFPDDFVESSLIAVFEQEAPERTWITLTSRRHDLAGVVDGQMSRWMALNRACPVCGTHDLFCPECGGMIEI